MPARGRKRLAERRWHECEEQRETVLDRGGKECLSAVHYVHPDKLRPELWINEVGVAASHRRRGLGTRLLLAVFAVV